MEKKLDYLLLCLYIFSSLLSWCVLILLITWGHPFELLNYNFRDVAGDQWWLFGPYGENFRVFGPHHLLRLIFYEQNFIPLLVLLLSAILAFKSRQIEHVLLVWVGVALLAGRATEGRESLHAQQVAGAAGKRAGGLA
jgi:hypothetical protein